MTDDQYWSAVKHHFGLARTSFRAGAMILCKTRENTHQYVTDPSDLTPEERIAELKNLAQIMDIEPPGVC